MTGRVGAPGGLSSPSTQRRLRLGRPREAKGGHDGPPPAWSVESAATDAQAWPGFPHPRADENKQQQWRRLSDVKGGPPRVELTEQASLGAPSTQTPLGDHAEGLEEQPPGTPTE